MADPTVIIAFPPGLTIHNTLGALLVGFALSCCVYGVLMVQIVAYFRRYPLDKLAYKLIVLAILALTTADQALIGHVVYYYGIVEFSDMVGLLKANVLWSLVMQLTIGAIVGAVVKISYSLRVWRFSGKNYWITALALTLSLGHLGVALAFAVKCFEFDSIFDVVHLRVLGTISLSIGVLADLVIAVSLSLFLNRLRTGYQRSDSLVNTLVRYAISTGSLTAAVSLSCVILYNTMPNNLIFIAVYFILSKLYAISYLATLNTRRMVRGKGTDRHTTGSGTHRLNTNNIVKDENDTNMFHLGTRMPSMGPNELEHWDDHDQEMPSPNHQAKVIDSDTYPMQAFPKAFPVNQLYIGQAV